MFKLVSFHREEQIIIEPTQAYTLNITPGKDVDSYQVLKSTDADRQCERAPLLRQSSAYG